MAATTKLESIPSSTPEAASASLQGVIMGFGQGGHEVNVRGIDIQELDDGTFIAYALIEIEDLEEEEEQRPEDRESEAKKAEEIIEKENELYWMTHGQRGSEAERALPDGGEPLSADEIVDADTTPRLSDDQDETIGIDQDPVELSETLENDFSQAMNNEPPPPGTLPDSALAYPAPAPAPAEDMTVSEMSVEELEAEVERRKREEAELAASLAAAAPEDPAPATE